MEEIENISNSDTLIVQNPIKILDSEDEENKKNNESKEIEISDESYGSEQCISKVVFNHKYFLSSLQKVGAVNNFIEEEVPISLVKTPNITIGLVLAAKSINFFTDEEIIKWIRKGRKLTPLIEKQFSFYEKLSHYLKNHVDVKDIDKWASLFDSKYAFPLSDNEDWSLIFGEIPELCHKIDEKHKFLEQLENSKNQAHNSYKEEETTDKEIDEVNKSSKQEVSLKVIDDEQKTFKQLETQNTKMYEAQISCNKLETSKTDIDDDQISFNQSEPQKTGIGEAQISCNQFKTTNIEIEKNNIADKTNSCYNPAGNIKEQVVNEISENGDRNKEYIDKSNAELFNLSGNRISSPDLCNDHTKAQTDSDTDSSDCDDDLDDLFSAVGAELTAAETNEEKSQADCFKEKNKEYLCESLIQTKVGKINQNLEKTIANDINDGKPSKSKDCLSDDDIYDDSITLDYEVDIDSDIEMQEECGEDKSNGTKDLDLKVNRKELMKAEFDDTEAKTIETKSTCIKLSDNSNQLKSENSQRIFTMKYFRLVLQEAGMWEEVRKGKLRVLQSDIPISLVLAVIVTDKFTNSEIKEWIGKCCNKSKFNLMTACYKDFQAFHRWLANYLMNEVNLEDEEKWKILLNETTLKFEGLGGKKKLKFNFYDNWEQMFGYIPEICHRVEVKFNYNFYLSQLLGYNAIKRSVKKGIMQYHLVETEYLRVGLVLAAKAVDIFPDKDIVLWISKSLGITSIDSEKIHELLEIYKELYNYLEKEADSRDYVDFFNRLFNHRNTFFKLISPIKVHSDLLNTDWTRKFGHTFMGYFPHNRFKDFECSYDRLLSSEKLASMEIAEPEHHEAASEVCKVWNDLFLYDFSSQVSDKQSNDKPFHSNYFRSLLISEKVTEGWSSKLNKIEKLTVGLVMAAIHEQVEAHQIADWIEECCGKKSAKDKKRQFFMYKILCDHLLSLTCNIESFYWKQLINSVDYQDPIENYDIWSNIFGRQIPNLLGVTFIGKMGFEKTVLVSKFRIRHCNVGFIECIQLSHDLQNSDFVSIKEKQNLLFDKEYFASLLSGCWTLSDSNRILKSMPDLTIGQVMAAVIDNTVNEEEISMWIKQSENNPWTKKTLETLNLKSQFFSYKLLASYLMNYPSASKHDSYLNSWRDLLKSKYVFSTVGAPFLERFVSPKINSVDISIEWCISKKYELKSIVNEVRKGIQIKSFGNINDIMVSKEKCIPIFHIININKTFGIGKSFLIEMLTKDKVLNTKDNTLMAKVGLPLTLGHVVGAVALGVFKDKDIKNWITKSMGFNGIVPFGPIKRLVHYLLCEAPTESAGDWKVNMNIWKFNYWEKKDGLGQIPSLFPQGKTSFKTSLYKDIETIKHKDDYIPNECKMFIRGICTVDDCKKLHICCKMKFCMSFPKEEHEASVTPKNYESKSIMTAKDKRESSNLKVVAETDYMIPKGFCRKYNTARHCSNISCQWLHKCAECNGKHPLLKCRIRIEKEQDGSDKSGNNSVEAGNNKRPRSPNKCSSNSHLKDNEFDIDTFFDDMENFDNDSEERKKKKSKFESEQFVSSGKNSSNSSLKVDESDSEVVQHGKASRISGMCNAFNKSGRCPHKECWYPHRCDECGGEHPRFECNVKMIGNKNEIKTGENTLKNRTYNTCKHYNDHEKCHYTPCAYDHNCFDCGGEHPRTKCNKTDIGSGIIKGVQEVPRLSGMCKAFNKTGVCHHKECWHPHRCNECGAEHPRLKCPLKMVESVNVKGVQEVFEISGMCNEFNKTGVCPHKQCWHPHRCSQCGAEHPRFKCPAKKIKSVNEKELSAPVPKVYKLLGMCREFNINGKCGFDAENITCKYIHCCDQCGGDHPRIKCSMEKSRPGENLMTTRIPGMCNKYNNLENCVHTPCLYPHKCDECGGEHPRKKCCGEGIKRGNAKGVQELHRISGMCNAFNNKGVCPHKQCRHPHRCDNCGAEHPRLKCLAKMVESVNEKGKDRSSRRDSRSRSPVHRISRDYQHQSLLMPTPTARHQLPSIPAQPTIQHQSYSVPPPPIHHHPPPHQPSQIPASSSYPHKSQSAYPSNYPPTSQSAYQSDYPHVSQSGYQPKMVNTSDTNKSLLSGAVEKIAKLTFNKDTAFIIEQIKKEIEILGIPSTMETIGKLIVEISEKHASLLSGVVEKVAKHTLNEDTSSIIEHIKRGLGYLGIPATMDIIGKLIMEISEKHEKMKVMKRNHSDEYGHGLSSSNPINEPSVNINYGQPNFNQSSGMPPQQTSGHMYQSSGHNPQSNTWNQSSSRTDQNSSGIHPQQGTGHMDQSSSRNNQPINAWFQSSGRAEPNNSGMPFQQGSGNMGNMLGQNEGNVMMHQNQWNQGTPGSAPGMQGWYQGQGPPGPGQMWSQ